MITKPRWMKSKDERLDDTMVYIAANLSLTDAQEVDQAVTQMSKTRKNALAKSLSIGATGTSTDRETNREARRAKRAVMLVTSLFLNDLAYLQRELTRIKALPENSEQDILAELKSWFVVPGVNARDVADTAVANIGNMPKWQNLNVQPDRAVRGRYDAGHEFNCYNAVVFWAFQGGTISRRFLWNHLHGKDGNAFFPIFSSCGWTTKIEYDFGHKPPRLVNDAFGGGKCTIDKGLAVYFVTPHKKFGHVALSLGDGNIISQNSVIPARRELAQPEDQVAITQMQQAITHIISIRNFWNIHYFPENGYHKLQHTTTPFWEPYPLNER